MAPPVLPAACAAAFFAVCACYNNWLLIRTGVFFFYGSSITVVFRFIFEKLAWSVCSTKHVKRKLLLFPIFVSFFGKCTFHWQELVIFVLTVVLSHAYRSIRHPKAIG